MRQWFDEHQGALYWLMGASVVVCVATVIAVSFVLARVPSDYFVKRRRPQGIHGPWGLGRNLLGFALILAGLAMLVLPGQGVLALLVGIMLVDFPGKFRFETWIVSRKRVAGAINWIRRHCGRPPIKVPARS